MNWFQTILWPQMPLTSIPNSLFPCATWALETDILPAGSWATSIAAENVLSGINCEAQHSFYQLCSLGEVPKLLQTQFPNSKTKILTGRPSWGQGFQIPHPGCLGYQKKLPEAPMGVCSLQGIVEMSAGYRWPLMGTDPRSSTLGLVRPNYWKLVGW